MRHIRTIGIVLAAGAILAVVAGSVRAVRAQAPRNSGPTVRPDLQILSLGGAEIGVTIRDADKGEGVAVTDVRNDSPAAKAGIKAGDVITEFDGEKVRSTRQLTRLVQETPGGHTVKLAVMRDGKRVDLSVTPEVRTMGIWSDRLLADTDKLRQDLRDRFGGDVFMFGSPGSGRLEILQPAVRLGVSVQDLTPQLAAYFGAKEGVLVASVSDGSAAARAGLKAGDVITAVNDKAIAGSSELARRLREAGADAEVTIALTRDRRAMTVKARLESPASRSPRAVRRTIVV